MTQKEYVKALNDAGKPHGLKVTGVLSITDKMVAPSTKQVTFNNGLQIQMQQPEIDTTAFAVIMDNHVKNILVIDRQTVYGKTTLVCLNLDDPAHGFVASKTLVNSLTDIGMVIVANMKITESGISYDIGIDRRVNDFRKNFSSDKGLILPYPVIQKVGDYYVLRNIIDNREPGINELEIPDFVNFIAIGGLYKAIYRKRTMDDNNIIMDIIDDRRKTRVINDGAIVCDIVNAEECKYYSPERRCQYTKPQTTDN